MREAITVANANGGPHTIAFDVPPGDLTGGVAIISPASPLPPITRNNVVVDGTTQTANRGNTNPATLGSGGTAGVDALPISTVPGPEVEIRDGAAIAIGLQIQASNVTIRGLAILGFGAANGEGAIVIDAGSSGALIENNVVGSSATSFTDPGLALRNYSGIESVGGDGGTIQDNLIGFGHRGVFLNAGSNSWIVDGNEIRDHDLSFPDGDGIAIDDSSGNTIRGNRITGTSSQGFVVTSSSGSNFVNNTLTGNGIGSLTSVTQSAGITLRSTASATTIDRNILHSNYGAGIQINDGATGTVITQNSFADNGTIIARDLSLPTDQIGIDLNVAGDDTQLGTPDYFSVNDQLDTLQDFPILESAEIAGGNLTLTGWSKPNATIEVFIAAADPHGFGEGESYIGTFVEGVSDGDPSTSDYSGLINGLDQGADVNASRFSFTVPVASLAVPASDGDQLTSTATLAGETSEFSGLVTAAAINDISGTVFEDLAGNVLDGAEVIGDVANPVVSGVDVYLYLDDGGTLGIPDATDTIQNGGSPVATNGSGAFTFSSVPNGTYWVVVNSRTVSPATGVHPSYLATTPWSEQTYGPDKGWCADGIGGTSERVGDGPCYGGVDGATDDDASALTSSEHVARVVVLNGDISGIDFGFSYNVVTNVEPAGNVSLIASTYQGSIDQFVRNANSINGANAMRFVPAIPTNAAGGGGAWWQVDYTGSVIGETITNAHDGDTSIDGTAYDLANGVAVRNTNTGSLGANAGGGLTVGVDGVVLPQVARPELEVMRSDPAVGVAFYFYSNGSTGQIPNNFAVRDIATWGFVGGVGMTGIAGMRPSGVVVERNVIGSPPNVFVDPSIPGTLRGVALLNTDGATIRDNLIGFVDANGVTASAVTGTYISGNEIREAGQVDGVADGINYGGTSTTGTITANLIVNTGGMGVDGTATGNLVENNTVTGSGQLGVQTGGIRQTGSANTVRRNIITGSIGPGVIVPDTVNAIVVTENVFGANGSIAVDLVEAGGDTGAGDGIMLNDGALDAADGNDGLDYPIIDSAVLSGGNLTVTGFARAGVTIEFYEAVGAANDNNASGNPHGEGVAHLFTEVEGGADADPTTGASYTDPGYGTDSSANRFSFTVAAPAGLVIGEDISPVAYLAANGTSEFGPSFAVTGPNTTIAGTIFVDEAGDGLADGPIGPVPNAFEAGVRVELYQAGADGDADGGDDTYVGFTTSSGVDGSYSFTGLSPDIYYVTVDSQGVDDGPYNGAHTAADTWAEQTYGSVGAASFDGVTWTYAATAGAFYGGARWDVSDDHVPTNSLPAGEHIARADTAGGDVSNVDFGFSFNVVTTTRGASAAQDPGAGGGQRTVQGSLRQFITNANSQSGANAMRFVPAAPTNATLGGNNWWRVAITAQLPDMEDAFTTIDGAAYDAANGVALLNTNTASIGTGAAVGVSGTFNTPTLDPELEVQGDNIVNNGFFVLATADNSAVRNLAITSFVQTGIRPAGSLPDMLDALMIENNVIGASPASFTDNPALFVGRAIVARDLDNTTIRNNLIGWTGWGIQFDFDNEDSLIETNEFRGVDTWGLYLRGVASTGQQPERLTVRGNLVENSGNDGIYTTQSLSDFVIDQNSVRFNGTGVRLWGADNSVTGNIITDNSGTGLLLVGDGLPSYPAPSANLISQNQFGNNGLLGIDLVETGINQDGVTLNDNGDTDAGANALLNYPIIESAQIAGPNLIVSGFAAPGTNVEFYIADADPSGFGEGVTYLFNAIEGSGADTDATAGTYGPGPINGLAQGTDTTNRFTFTVPTPGGVGVGTDLTATGTSASATSEFSGRATVSNNADLVITKVLDPSTPGPFAEGDPVTYLLTVTNNGPAQATNVTATETYPGDLTLGVPVPSAPTTYVAGTGIWTIGTLNSGASATLTLPGTVNVGTAGNVVTNSVTAATGDQADPTTVGDDLVEAFTVLPFLSIDDVVQVETDSVPGTTTFTFTVSINQAIGTDVTFDFDTADNTATVADSDYVAIAGGSGTILTGATSTTIDVTVNGDDVIEPDEIFFVDVSNVVAAVVADGQGEGTISNDDGATVSIATATDANEAGPVNGQFTVTQSATSDSDTVITYSIAGSATAAGTDYTTLSGSVTVLAGDTTATIDVTGIVADALVEGNETVIVTLTGTDNTGITVAPSPNNEATVNILDANAATVIIASLVDGNEAGPVDGQFMVTQSTTSASDTVISYSIAGTATAGGIDYTSLSGSVTVLAGDTAATIDVTGIVADGLVEGTETVVVTLTATDNPAIAVAASPADTATISIVDGDTSNVSIAATTDGNEAGPVDGQFTVTQSITSASDTVISYTVAGTATDGGTDYTTLSGSVTVLAGDTTATIDVTGIVADALVEGAETVVVTLTGTDNPGITVAASPADTATISILDNNGASVSVAATTDGNEAGPVDGQFTVTQSTTSASDTVITYTVAGTATAGGTDYTSLSGSVTVLAGDTTATIDVTGIVADALIEGTETVVVTLTGTDNPGIAVAASPADTATVNILDNNGATVSIAPIVDANESGPIDGQFMVTQSTTSASDTVITYTVAGTATAGGTDYVSLSGSVTVLAGDTAATIDVTGIVADALVEGIETVIVTLTGTDNPGIIVAASPADTATVNIVDNNGATVSIAATVDANEVGPVDGQFTVTQSSASVSDTVITYTIAGTATAGGTDYATLSGSVTVLAGNTAATIDVTGIVADALVEGVETVIVTLTGTDNPGITVAASPADTATLNILDANAATVSIAGTTDANEAGPVDGQFTISQSAASISDTVITYTVAGTATATTDYMALSGSATILAGATAATINVTGIVADALVEGSETVIVTLTGTDNPGIAVAASPADTATVNIADNNSNLVTTKTVDNSTPQEGDTITYTLTVNNNAGAQATNVSLTDTLPAGATYVGDDSGGLYDSSTGVWNIGTLDTIAPNNIATLNIMATVDAGASSLAQPITNTTTAAIGDQADPDTSTDTLTAAITVDANADLVTTKSVDNASPVENATIIYTISVFNNGTAQASNVSLIDLLPTGVTYFGDDSGGAYNPVTGVWTIGTIDNAAIATLNISATVDTGAGALAQPITNITTAAIGDQPDPDTTTDDLTEDITVNYVADLVTTKLVDIPTPFSGDTIVYTLTATNNGPAPATNVSLTDTLPPGVTYVSDDAAGAYDNVTGVWTIGNLADGAVATLNISATVDTGAGLLPQPITNTITAAVGDQTDADNTGDDLSEDIIVNLIDPNLIQLSKTVGRDRATAGEIIAYNIEIRNTTANPIAAVRVSDSPARGFKYVPGTAQLDGVPVSDPTIGLPIEFDIGTLPEFVDADGNGVADPGEPGYAVLSYRMVAGSGVAPGVWTNAAIATANCDTCFVSNIANADIEITEDTLFDLGTIIGKVFYDGDSDGRQDSGEAGLEAAMVVLDDGTYALTDEFGRYHFPAIKPGQRLLKINLNSLAGQAIATNGKTHIVSVTPGLMAKVNFGVIIDTVDAAIGAEGELGIAVDSETTHPPLLINGSTLVPSLLVNGEPVSLASADVRLGTQKIRDVVELSDGMLTKPIRFSTRIDTDSAIKRWKLIVTGSRDEIAKTWKGKGSPPEFVEWDGVRKNGKLINNSGVYTYHLEVTTSDGQSVSSSRRLFGVNRRNSISLNLAGGAFVSGSHELTGKAKALLSETAKAIRAYPDEIVVITGHTDSVGSDESNMALAERRARSAYNYLRKNEGLPEEQFVIQAFGETRPIAGNDSSWGRELNRRVEISGDLNSIDRAKNYDPYRQPPVVRINSTDIEVDESGAFRTRMDLESGQESMKVLLTTSQGRSVETMVQLPTLHVISPQGRIAIPIESNRAGPGDFDADTNDLLLHTDLLGRTEPGNIVEFNGETLDVDANGLFLASLPLRTGENYYGLVARSPTGVLRIANLKLTLDEASINEPEFVVEPIPQLALQLPPPGIPMTNANLVVPGSTVPGSRVFINDNEITVDVDGSFTATVELQLGENLFTARVVDEDGHAGQIEQTFDYNGDPIFFMALIDGTFSKLQTSGSLEASGNDKREETVSEGRVAYYLKGHVLGKYLLTSAFDSGRQELGEIFSDLSAQDNDRLLTNLDPDTLYPVYGDSSTLVYDAQSQGKFYLALESDTVTALVGNYALNFTDTELAGYQRTLYGASVTYQSAAKDEAGDSKTKAQAFHAKIEQAHVRDELRATGGSLYYLSQRRVIEGSEHISVIVRDQDSGLILRRTALQQGLDYSIDYVDGRLLTTRPISSFTADYSLIETDLLGGSAVYLQIDYETRLDGFEQTASGARIRQGVGERLAVGATAVDEDQLGGQYSLKAADAEYKLGKNSRVVAEFASSEGNNSIVNISEDGGLSYQAVPQTAGNSGDAYKIAAEIDAGEWFGVEDRFLLNTYFKHLDTGFSANSTNSEQGSEKSGFAASWKINDGSSLLGRYEQQTNLIDGSENTVSTVQWNLVRNQWGLAAEVEDREGFAGDSTLAALRMNYRWTDTLSTSLLHQQTLEGIDNDQSTVGVAYRATDKLTLDVSATHGTKGDSAQLGAQFDWRGNRLYAAQQINNLEESGLSNNRLVGVEAPFGKDGAVYSEYHWSKLPLGRQKQAMFGARQRFQATDGLRIEISGEHSAENATNVDTGERYALSVGAIFDNDNGLTLSTRNEYRRDTRSIASEQFLSTSNMKLALGNDLAVIGKYRFSKSESSEQIDRNIDFTEASFGLAYRPVEHDRLNLLTRITRLTNTPTEFQLQNPATGITSDIFAVDWSYQLSQGIEWVGKQAMRWSENDDDPLDLRSRTSLTIQRLNWSMPKQLRLGTEYRFMNQDVANDRRNGFVTELMWDGLDPVVLGLGYNFSDVSDNEYVDYDFSTKGPFLRLQGKF